jgi:hypothetical protein
MVTEISVHMWYIQGPRGGAVGWGTALQAERSQVRFPIVSLVFFYWHNSSGRTMALGLTQPLTEMSTRKVKAAGLLGWKLYHLHVPIVLKSGSLNLLELSGLIQACNGIAYLIWYIYI